MRMDEVAGGVVTLRNGVVMPRIGLGTWPMDDAEAERVVADALAAGYRLVDTAENYGNERGVGAGVRASGLPREDVFVTTKFNREWHSVAGVRTAFERSAERLGFDYVDLMLIHWPNPDQDRYVEAWLGLIALLESGAVRAIGVSNFTSAHLTRLIGETSTVPAVNQVEINPRIQLRETQAFDSSEGIVTQAWRPLGKGNGLLDLPAVVAVAQRNSCTPAQAVLAWHLAHGLTLVAKSSDPARLRSNLAAGSMTLDHADLAELDALDGGQVREYHPDEFGH